MSLFFMLKRNSKLALRGFWGRAILASAIVLGASMALSVVQGVLLELFAPPVRINPEFALRYGFSEFFFEQFTQTALIEWSILALFIVVELLLIVPLTLGVVRWHFLLVRSEEPGISEIFHFFESPRQFGRSIWLHVNLFFRCFAWALLLLALPSAILGASLGVTTLGEEAGRPLAAVASMGVLLGSIMLLLALFLFGALISRYLPASYLVCENDDISVRQAIKESVRCSKGYRFSLLWYQLSFIGWALLCAFVFPMLYVVPYVNTAIAMYARYIIERGRFTPPSPTREFRPEESGQQAEEAWAPSLTDTAGSQPDRVQSWPDFHPQGSVWPEPAAASETESEPMQPAPGREFYTNSPPASEAGGVEAAVPDPENDPAIWPEPDQPFRDRKD